MARKKHIVYHRDGSLWAKGYMAGKLMEGKWTWFRKDGTKMRTGSFQNGKQIGEWITHDKHGHIVKKTMMKG